MGCHTQVCKDADELCRGQGAYNLSHLNFMDMPFSAVLRRSRTKNAFVQLLRIYTLNGRHH